MPRELKKMVQLQLNGPKLNFKKIDFDNISLVT